MHRFLWLVPLLLIACQDPRASRLFEDDGQAALLQRASELEAAVTSRLSVQHRDVRGSVWAETRVDLPEDWILTTTPELWASPAEARPQLDTCDSGESCHPQFARRSCESDTDCRQGSQCKPLLATVDRLGNLPTRLCQYPSDHLLDALYTTVIQAEEQLDLTSLSAPNGMFHEALVNALSIVSQQSSLVKVRILYSGDQAAQLNILQPPKRYLERLEKDLVAHHGRLASLSFNVAWLSSAQLSWNHTKIIVADRLIGLQGGHNWWDADYLGISPVSDISMYLRGAALEPTVAFIDRLWQSIPAHAVYAPRGERFGAWASSLPQEESGESPALTLGRLGVFGPNSADDGLKALIDATESELLLSQQDLYNITTALPITRTYVREQLFRALLRDVKISIIQSNKDGINYGMVAPHVTLQALIREFEAFVKRRKIRLPGEQDARSFFCQRLEYAPHRFSRSWTHWENARPLLHHMKLIIADRAAFYLGSQNLYPSNLQEFGLVVFDPAKTRELLERYWEPAAFASEPARIACP